MLYSGSDVIRDLEWVIFDEVHYINDAEVSGGGNKSPTGLVARPRPTYPEGLSSLPPD